MKRVPKRDGHPSLGQRQTVQVPLGGPEWTVISQHFAGEIRTAPVCKVSQHRCKSGHRTARQGGPVITCELTCEIVSCGLTGSCCTGCRG